MQQQKSVYGIIGNPVAHSLSPVMHNAAFKELDVDAEYKLFPLEENELDDFFQELRKPSSHIFGLNVTVPYKEKVLEYMDTLSPLVEKIRAVNTIVITDDRKFIAYNTDAPGFMAHLTELKVETKDKRVVILGAGGSTRAILATLCMIPERPESIRIFNRSEERAVQLIKNLGCRIDMGIVEISESIDDCNIELADILINTTSVGMKKNDDCLVGQELLNPNIFVYDIIYSPSETELLKAAKQKGAKTSNGLGMLYYQGVLSLEHWANTRLDNKVKSKMRKNLESAVLKK